MSNIHLGPGPEIPSMTSFVQTSLQNIMQATSMEQFNAAFDALFAKNSTFVLNGTSVSRATYSEALLNQSAAKGQVSSASMELQQSVENNDINLKIKDLSNPGVASVTYQVTITPQTTSPQLPLGIITSSAVNFVVENNNSLGGNRKIVDINHVTS